MKIGTKEFPDKCPNCGEVTGWIKMPLGRIISEGGGSYSMYKIKCFKCEFKTNTFKIKDSENINGFDNIEDVTEYKDNLFNKLIILIKSVFIRNKDTNNKV